MKLIAEPWDIGPGGYQVGGFPPGWAEWNDKFRDTVRAFWKGDEGKLPELATRLAASADAFGRRGRKPWSSVNFITAHDGFTLHDLVSYNDKHNEANGEDNQDGHSRQSVVEPRRRRARPKMPRSSRCATGRSATCWRRCCWRRARRCCSPATSSAARSRATTTPMRRTMRSAGSTGTSPRTARALIEFVRRVIALRQAFPILRAVALPHRRIQRRTRREGRALADAGGDRHRSTSSGRTPTRAASAC